MAENGKNLEKRGSSGQLKEKSHLTPMNSKQARKIESTEEDNETAAGATQGTISAPSGENAQNADLEALAQVPSSRPVHSVFGKKQKMFIIFMASLGGFFSPLSANIYFPALPALAQDLKVSNELINLTLTSYMIFQGLAPTFMGDLADVAGRRPVYIICFIIYIAACIGIALQDNYAALMVLRCVQSSGSSATIALAYGVVSDVASSSRRGTYMSFVSMGAMAGPAVGPVLGGILSEFLGWRAIFWFLTIIAVIYLVLCITAFPETARKIVGNGSIPPPPWSMTLLNYYSARRHQPKDDLAHTLTRDSQKEARAALERKRAFKFPNPLKAIHIVFQKDAGILLLYNSWVYTAFYCIITTVPQLFAEIYGFNDLQIGLSFMPFGFGCVLASLSNGRVLDWNYRRVARKAGISVDRKRGEDMRHFPIEKARLPIVFPLLYAGQIAIIVYGWVLQVNGPLPAVLVLLFLVGFLANGAFNAMSTMLIDLFPTRPATATAANNLVRCWMGAGGTAVISLLLNALGRGWTFTLIGALVLLASPMPIALLKWGPQWREERWVKEEQHRKEKEERERRKRESTLSANTVDEKIEQDKALEADLFGANVSRVHQNLGGVDSGTKKLSANPEIPQKETGSC